MLTGTSLFALLALVVQGVLLADTPDSRQKMIQMAERAFSRLQ